MTSEIGNTIIRTPIVSNMSNQTQKRIQKATIKQTNRVLEEIRYNCLINQNKPALLYQKEGREFIPRLVEVIKCYPGFVLLQYKCYDPEGNFRQYLRTSPGYVDFLTGDVKLKFFDGDI